MKVRRVNVVVLNVILLVFLVVSVNGSVLNEYYFQALPVSCETPKAVLQSGTAGSSTIYTNSTSAKVSVAAPRNWWNTDYDYRRQISIVNNVASTLGSGYSVCLTVNTTSLVSSGKMLLSGNDLRIVYWNGSSWIELDRDVIDMNTGSTQVWFKTRADISASGSDNNNYMYYCNPSAADPPANKSNVYDFWDDFDNASLDPAWTFSQIGGAAGSYSETGTIVILNATNSGDLWGTSDNFLFLSISRSYDVLVESYTSGWGGSHQTWSKMGGVQLRQSLDANSKNRIMSPVYSAVGATNSYRLSTGDSTFEQTTSTQPKYCRLSRIGGTSRAWYSTDGISWTELGSQISFSGGLSDPVRLGIHLAGLSSSSHWVEVDWFKARKYVDPEPSTFVGSEESYSYFPTGYNMLSWWDPYYGHRKRISITNNATSTLDSGYSVYLSENTASLIFAGKMLSSGNDLRIIYRDGSSSLWVELDRDVIDINTTSTQVWFKTQADIPASGSDDNYYMYYGNPSAESPPANKNNVYVWFDDFSTNTLANYDEAKWVDIHGAANEYVLPTYDAVNERVWFDTGDNYASDMYPKEVIEADFLMAVDFWANGSYPSDATIALVGRLENPGVSSTHYYLDFSHGYYDSPGITLDSWTTGERSNTVYSEPSDYYWGFNTVHTFRYAIFGSTHKFWWNKDISQPADVIATDSLHTAAGRVGLAPAQVRGWWDNFKVRKYVEPEPSVFAGSEEQSYYVSGTVPGSVQVIDSDYLIIKSAGNRWWDQNYHYRKQIAITNNAGSTLSFGYSACVTVDTASLVLVGKMLSNGSDLRIVYWNGTSLVQLDRHIINMNTTSTQVWFKTQANIPASSSDNNYYMYYGNPTAINPPAYWSDSMGADSLSRVFWYADSFEEHANNTDPDGWTDEGSEDYKVVVYEGNRWLKRVVRVDWEGGSVATSMSNIGDAVWMVDIRYNQSGSNVWGGVAFHYANGGVGYHFLIRDQGWYWANEDWTVTDGWNTNTDIHFTLGQTGTIKVTTVGTTAYCYWENPNGESPSQVLVTTKTIASGTGKAKIIVESPSVDNNRWIDADNFIVRKYVEPEPSTSLGSETNPKHEVSTEFIFSGMTENTPTQLNFTVVSEYDIASVSVTIQVWNYSLSAYVTSGEGYLTYASTGTNVTKVISINTNPQFYTSNGYAKIKVTGVNSTATQFHQKVNQIKLDYEYSASSTYDHVLKVVNQVTDAWNVSLKVYDSSNIAILSSITISFHDGTTSDQIIVSGGNITQSEGALYDLAGSTTIYISISSLQAISSGVSYLYVYLKILVPGTSTYNLFVIRLEIT